MSAFARLAIVSIQASRRATPPAPDPAPEVIMASNDPTPPLANVTPLPKRQSASRSALDAIINRARAAMWL